MERHIAATSSGVWVIARINVACSTRSVDWIGAIALFLVFFAIVGVACYLNEPQRRARRTNNGESAQPQDTGIGSGVGTRKSTNGA
jgi:hypothetical protein